jgi:hypothetical protein
MLIASRKRLNAHDTAAAAGRKSKCDTLEFTGEIRASLRRFDTAVNQRHVEKDLASAPMRCRVSDRISRPQSLIGLDVAYLDFLGKVA